MFIKPVECNASIVYGMFCSIEQILIAKDARKYSGSLEQFIRYYGLDLVPVGDIDKSQEYIIGKKIDYYHNFLAIKIKYNNDGTIKELKHMNNKVPEIKMSISEEQKVKQSILKLGVMGMCDYYFIHTYKSNGRKVK